MLFSVFILVISPSPAMPVSYLVVRGLQKMQKLTVPYPFLGPYSTHEVGATLLCTVFT